MPPRSFTELEVWRLADEPDTENFRLAQSLPPDERFRLTDQMIRAARSIPANVAEGFGCHRPKRKVQFYEVGTASCAELMNHVIVAAKRRWCKDPGVILDKIDRLQRLLHRLILATLRMPGLPATPRPELLWRAQSFDMQVFTCVAPIRPFLPFGRSTEVLSLGRPESFILGRTSCVPKSLRYNPFG